MKKLLARKWFLFKQKIAFLLFGHSVVLMEHVGGGWEANMNNVFRRGYKVFYRPWMDKDEIMFHACFQILVNFIEQEKPWQSPTCCIPDNYRAVYNDLYAWYKGRRWENTHLHELNKKIDEEKEEKLLKLITHREYLWD